jgi:hypothetical protein
VVCAIIVRLINGCEFFNDVSIKTGSSIVFGYSKPFSFSPSVSHSFIHDMLYSTKYMVHDAMRNRNAAAGNVAFMNFVQLQRKMKVKNWRASYFHTQAFSQHFTLHPHFHFSHLVRHSQDSRNRNNDETTDRWETIVHNR